MSYQVSVSGHANGDDSATQKTKEAEVLRVAKDFVTALKAHGEVYTPNYTSQYHGSGNLNDLDLSQ